MKSNALWSVCKQNQVIRNAWINGQETDVKALVWTSVGRLPSLYNFRKHFVVSPSKVNIAGVILQISCLQFKEE